MKYHRFFDGLRPTVHISHRGGSALAPENTLAAFRMAVEQYRTEMLELDVHFTRDRVAVVAHDDTVDRCTDGQGRIRDLSSAEVARLDAGFHFPGFRGRGARIPSLSEVLRAFPRVRVNLDLKDHAPDSVAALAELLREEGAVGRVCVGSDDDAVGASLAAALPEACHFYPRDALAAFVMSVRTGEEPPEDLRYSVLDMPLDYEGIRLIDAALLEAAHSRGKWINVWTIDDPAEMRRLIAEGIGGIMTDRPDLLRQALDEAQRK